MEKQPSFNAEERIVTLQDIVRFFQSQSKRLIRIALLGGFCLFSFYALKTPKYRAEATFKEGVEKSGAESSLKSLLGDIGGVAQQPQAVALMKSNQVLKPLVEKLGLQAGVIQPRWIVGKIYRRLRDNLRTELGKPLEDLDSFLFENVVYEGEDPQTFFLQFSGPDRFAVFGADRKTKAAEGCLGSEIHLSSLRFTILKTPKNLKTGFFYALKIAPWVSAVDSLRSQMKIASDKVNKSIYNLAFLDRDRKRSAQVLNELMAEYRRYLKRDHDQVAMEQLAYLEKKQEQLYGRLSHVFDEHVHYLEKNLWEDGFFSLNEESESFQSPYQKMFTRNLEIDLQLSHLEKEEGRLQGTNLPGFCSQEFKEIFREIQELKQQRDFIEISLQQKLPLAAEEHQLASRRDELREIRLERGAVEKLLEELDERQEISGSSFDWNDALYLWAKRLEDGDPSAEREDLCEYLENYSRLLSVREKMLQERFFYGNRAAPELEGIGLKTANQLFVEYNNKIAAAESALCHYSQFREEISRKEFELGSLSAFLKDPFSQNLIAAANKVAVQLKDEKNYSSKEGQRWQEELDLQRKILSEHLAQLIKVEELNISLYREKMVGLQQVQLDCINRQLSVLYESVQQATKELRESLLREKKILVGQMQEIRHQASGLPEKWRSEKWLDLKTEIGQKMMETLTQLVESKTIGHHLHHVESKPLDEAVVPLSPNPPLLFAKAFMGAFGAAFGAFFLSLVRKILKGFPVSLEKLQAMGLPAAGPLASSCDGPGVDPLTGSDLDLLRRLSVFIEGGKVIGLIGGKGPDYSHAFCENLARMSYKSIVLRCDFKAKFRDEDLPGLLQAWKGEAAKIPVRKGKGYDWINPGGYTPFGAEIVQSPLFAKWVEELKKSYDWVFLLLREPLASAGSVSALRLCDKAIVTVLDEPVEILTPFVEWAYHKGDSRLTFVVSS